jgi:nucleoid-associated protein EbfC
MLPEGFDLSSIMMQAQKMQENVASAQEALGRETVVGTAGGGLVKATVTGLNELIGLELAPEVVDPQDIETLVDLILAAVRDAGAGADRLQEEKMGPLTSGMGGLGGLSPF